MENRIFVLNKKKKFVDTIGSPSFQLNLNVFFFFIYLSIYFWFS